MLRAIVRAGVVSWALVGCQGSDRDEAFLATRVPIARLDSVLEAADDVRLRLGDARTLLRLVAQAGFAARLPHDTMSVADILTWARAEHVQQERRDSAATAARLARQEELRRRLDSLLTATVVSKSYFPKDPDVERYEDYISLTFAYRNTGRKAIRAFQGDVTFVDAFGDTVYSAHLKVDVPLRPGQTRREPGRIIRYNPLRAEHQRLRDTPLSKLTTIWQPSEVLFADGSRVSLAADLGEQ